MEIYHRSTYLLTQKPYHLQKEGPTRAREGQWSFVYDYGKFFKVYSYYYNLYSLPVER